jgi:hypothetical protein
MDAGKVIELITRLQDTRLDKIYGSAGEDLLIIEEYAPEMEMDKEDVDVRTINLCLKAIEIKRPVYGFVKIIWFFLFRL